MVSSVVEFLLITNISLNPRPIPEGDLCWVWLDDLF